MVQVGTPGAKKGLFSVAKLRASGLGGSLAHELRVHFESVPSLHTPPPLGLGISRGLEAIKNNFLGFWLKLAELRGS